MYYSSIDKGKSVFKRRFVSIAIATTKIRKCNLKNTTGY